MRGPFIPIQYSIDTDFRGCEGKVCHGRKVSIDWVAEDTADELHKQYRAEKWGRARMVASVTLYRTRHTVPRQDTDHHAADAEDTHEEAVGAHHATCGLQQAFDGLVHPVPFPRQPHRMTVHARLSVGGGRVAMGAFPGDWRTTCRRHPTNPRRAWVSANRARSAASIASVLAQWLSARPKSRTWHELTRATA